MSMLRNEKTTVLLGEDESDVRAYLEMALKCQGFAVESARDGEEVLAYLRDGGQAAAVLLDIVMPGKDGIDTLRSIREIYKELPVIMLSGESTTLNIVEAMRSGATDFLSKPVNHDDLSNTIRKCVDLNRETPLKPVAAPPASYSTNGKLFYGLSAKMQEIQTMTARVGNSDAPVLIQGETGVGKEMIARELHARSPRANKPFLKLNCAALPSELVESELFGYERGAFTGAFQRKPGMFEMADQGTILLDEIGDMDYKLQAKLLQVLQDHQFQRLGGKDTIHVDVRVISATHRNLEEAIINRTFREDLYYRLAVVTLEIPPLRERKADLFNLADMLMRKYVQPPNIPPVFTTEMRQAFLAHDWPGNVRELENVIRKFMILRNPKLIIAELTARANKTLGAAAGSGASLERAPISARATIFEQVTTAKDQA
jgi:two-component system response regulator AtoC